MADSQTPAPGGANGGVLSVAIRTGGEIAHSLPPAFLGLCVVNSLFIGGLLWFLGRQMDQRMSLVAGIVDRCLAK